VVIVYVTYSISFNSRTFSNPHTVLDPLW